MADHWNPVQYFQAHRAEAHATVSRPARLLLLLPWCLHLLYLLPRCHLPWQPSAESRDLRELLEVMADLNSHTVSDNELLCSMIRRALNSALARGREGSMSRSYIPCRTRCRYSSLGGCFLFLSILPGFASEAICWSTHHLSQASKAENHHTTPCSITCNVKIRGFAYRLEATLCEIPQRERQAIRN